MPGVGLPNTLTLQYTLIHLEMGTDWQSQNRALFIEFLTEKSTKLPQNRNIRLTIHTVQYIHFDIFGDEECSLIFQIIIAINKIF